MNRAGLVAASGKSIRKGSKSFHMASRLFDRTTRERAWMLYCWCRHCDDVCDGQEHGFAAEASALDAVSRLKAETLHALAGGATGGLPFAALAQLQRECPVPEKFIIDHLDGFALDAEGWRPQDEKDLLRYCYHVAGAVGCMMAVVMGVDPHDKKTLGRASDLGIAFQLANIARDLRDDHKAGRCYIPAEWIEEYGIDPEDPFRTEKREGLVAVAMRICALAETHEHSARRGLAALRFRARWAVSAAARIYVGIGRRVASSGAAAWDRRIFIPRWRKLLLLAPSLGDAVRQRERT